MSRNLERQRLLSALARKRKANPYGLKPGTMYGPRKGSSGRKARLGRGSA